MVALVQVRSRMLVKDRIIMMIAFAYCYTWHKLRCRTFRRIDDFNYHVFALPISQIQESKFIKKKVEVNNEYEKSVSVKISNICIRYSFDKTIRQGDVVNTNEVPEWVIKNAIVSVQKPHQKSTVVQLTKRGSDVTARSSNS